MLLECILAKSTRRDPVLVLDFLEAAYHMDCTEVVQVPEKQ